MPTSRAPRRFGQALTLVLAVLASASAAADGPAQTLANLQEAYNGEVNAEARYLACADRADAEDHPCVAALFRAAAAAEHIHAAGQAEVLRALGVEPQARIVGAVVGSTRTNLQDAVAGERYERETMYPEFIAVAQREGLPAAARALASASAVEAGHAELFAAALADLANLANPGAIPCRYAICAACGGTRTAGVAADRCEFCGTAGGTFLTIPGSPNEH